MPRLYPSLDPVEIGARRWTVECAIIRPDVDTSDGIDPDADTDTLFRVRSSREEAFSLAREMLKKHNVLWGSVEVGQQEAVWFEEEEDLAEWITIGETYVILPDD